MRKTSFINRLFIHTLIQTVVISNLTDVCQIICDFMLFEKPCPRNSKACRYPRGKSSAKRQARQFVQFFLRLYGNVWGRQHQTCLISTANRVKYAAYSMYSFLNCEKGFIRTVVVVLTVMKISLNVCVVVL